MQVSWITNTFEQFNGITFYVKNISPLLAKRVDLKIYTGRVRGTYPYEVKALRSISNPIFSDYDLVIPFVKFKGDILHVHTPYGLGIVTLSSPVPKVATTHSLPHHMVEFMFKKDIPQFLLDIGWRYLVWFYNHFDRVVCQTHATEEMYRRRGLKAKTVVIPNGINAEGFKGGDPNRFRKTYGLKEPFAMYLGRLDYTKRPEWVVKIAESLPKYKFLIVGFGPLEKEIPRPPNVVFLKRLTFSEKVDAYTAATMLIMPSRVETEGIVAQEAMACGTPVIIADNDVLHEVIGGAGFRCLDIDDIKEKVKNLFEDEKLQFELKAKAVEQVRKRDIYKSVNLLTNLYEKLV